ncbi:MAG TPA: hypothetical protein VFA33_10505 [Bryobacteraceae bacterium]|nr:hypothetical protein [Bryobacteraceae bacterium]
MLLRRRLRISAGPFICWVILAAWTPATAQTQPAYANFEGAQTNPVRLSPNGTRLFAVNTANASLSVFSLAQSASPKLTAQIPVGLEPVSVNPRTNDEVWVVNQASDSISVVSVSKGVVTDTIYVPDEPMDVVFAGSNQAYVTCSRNNQIDVINTLTHTVSAVLPVTGGNPRALAVSPSGTTVYAAFALAGNATTIIPANLAPPQPPPTNPALPPPPQVALIVAATDPNWSSHIKYLMPANGVVAITTGSTPTVAGYYSHVGTINLGIAVNPVTGDLFVSNTDALNLTFFEPNLRGHFVNNRITRIQIATGQITPFDLNPNINYQVLPNPTALAQALAQPVGVVFDPSGAFLYVAAFGTDRVAKVDTNGNVLSFVEVSLASGSGSNADPKNKRGPRGLALNSGAQKLYVLNRISNTLSTIDTSQGKLIGEVAVGNDPTPTTVKQGRGFLYDAKLSGNGTNSCASCHVDAEMDHLAWNLGDPGGNMTSIVQNGVTFTFHPMKGPMTTQTLRGLVNMAPYHWRGDKPNFAAFNSAFNSLMGGSELSDSDMSIYTTFANSILYQPNPNQNMDRTLPTSFNGANPVQGESDFMTIAGTGAPGSFQTCTSCHTANPGPGSNLLIDPQSTPQYLKNPHLRNIYQKQFFNKAPGGQTIDGFGMKHDGTVADFLEFFNTGPFTGYTTQQRADMSSYVLCFDTGTAPTVGFTQTLTSTNVTNTIPQKNWSLLQSQAEAGNIDLIARGLLNNQTHGLLYKPSSNTYAMDSGQSLTQANLQKLIQAGGILTVMGVYPGTGSAQF